MVEPAQRKVFYKEKIYSLPLLTTYKITRFKKILIFVIVVTLLLPLTIRADEISGPELLNILRDNDRIYDVVGYEFSFLLTTRAVLRDPDPNQGMVIMDCKASWKSEDSCAMKIIYYYEKEIPPFIPPENAGLRNIGYDPNGNQIKWRIMESYSLFTPDRNEQLVKEKSFHVDPNGQLAYESNIKAKLLRFPVGNRGTISKFDNFQLATGRGFSSHLNSITSVKTLPSGLTQVTANRLPDKGVGGTWELTIDPNTDCLVRNGTYTRTDLDKPTIVVTSEGLMVKDGLKIGKYGTYKYSALPEESFEATDISKIVGPNKLYNEVHSIMNNLPIGTPVSDLTDLMGKGPVRTHIK